MNVIGYMRVSTNAQAGEDRFGLDSQKQQIEQYCQAHGHTIVAWFEDTVSGASDDRPAFNKLVYGDVYNPPYEAVVVAKSDRIARDIYLYFAYLNALRRKGIEVISVSEDFGIYGAYAPILQAMMAAIGQVERYNIAQRTIGGRRVKATKGGYSGGKAPMGYRVENGHLIVNQGEVPVVRLVFALRDRGETIRGITNQLNAMGYTGRNGKAFATSTVQSILNNRRTYEGYYHYGKTGQWVRGEHQAILERREDND